MNQIYKKAAIYVRVSTLYQIDKDSLPLQKAELIAYSKFVLNIDDYEIFEDAGYSGKNVERPGFQRMMSRVRTGEFSHILVWKIDRISRNLLDFASLYSELKGLGVTFVSKNEQFDTSSAMGEAMLKIILVFAELERQLTSERVSAVMISRAEKGLWNGGVAPYGYYYDKQSKEIQINEPEADVVRQIFDFCEAGVSVASVAQKINALGYKTRKGALWSRSSIHKILSNPFYIGTYRYNYIKDNRGTPYPNKVKPKEEWILVEDHHPAIVTPEQFSKCEIVRQSFFSENFSKTYKRKHTHVFAGVLRCGLCGSQMIAAADKERKDGFRPSMYLCSKNRRSNDCENRYINDLVVGPFVMNYIVNIFKAQNNFGKSTTIEALERKLLRGPVFENVASIDREGLELMHELLKNGESETDIFRSRIVKDKMAQKSASEKSLLESERAKKERALNRLKSAYLYSDGEIPEKDYILDRKRITDEIDVIDSRLRQIEEEAVESENTLSSDLIAKASYFIIAQNLQDKRTLDYRKFMRVADPEIVKEFVQSAIQKVVILDGKIASITFKNGIEHKFSYLK